MLRLASVRSLLIPELHSAMSEDKEHIAMHGVQTVHRNKIGLPVPCWVSLFSIAHSSSLCPGPVWLAEIGSGNVQEM